MIRFIKQNDENAVLALGQILSPHFKFSLNDYSNCLVAEVNGYIRGFISYSCLYEYGELIDLVVSPEYRRQLIGTKLLLEAIKNLRGCGCQILMLEVRKSNLGAINFYKHHGFNIVSCRSNYYSNGEDAFIMKREIGGRDE